jgi:hypothetical protein
MSLADVIARVELLGQLQLQVHEDLVKLTQAAMMLDERLTHIEARFPVDRGIGRSP